MLHKDARTVEWAFTAAAQESWNSIKPIFQAYRKDQLKKIGQNHFRFNKAFYSAYMVETFDNAKFRQEDMDGLIDFTAKFENIENFGRGGVINKFGYGSAAQAEQTADEWYD